MKFCKEVKTIKIVDISLHSVNKLMTNFEEEIKIMTLKKAHNDLEGLSSLSQNDRNNV